MIGALWASPADRSRIAKARAAVVLFGGYDGSGNYGDVLQFAAAAELVRRLPGAPQVVAIVELGARDHHNALAERYPSTFEDVAFAHFSEGEGGAGLVELPAGLAPERSAVYVYGGGYLNSWWGGRKVAHLAAAERLIDGQPRALVVSGVQVEAAAALPGGVANDLLSRAAWIGVRDIGSLEHVRAGIGGDGEGRVELTGDDAVPMLRRGRSSPDAVVNFHLNEGHWVSEDPASLGARATSVLQQLGREVGSPLELQPVSAYEDPRTSEAQQVAALLDRNRVALGGAGLSLAAPLDLLDDAVENRLERFRRARLTVCCSYHVALTSLFAGIPALLLAENEYYEQKAAGLRDLFGLDDRMVGVRGTPEDAAAAIAAMVDGPGRSALLDRLRTGAADLAGRHANGQRAVLAAIGEGLADPAQFAPSPRTIARGVRRRIARSLAIERLSR